MSIIGISGKIGSGKDTVGNIIQCLTDGQTPEEIAYKINKGGKSYVNPHNSGWVIKKYADKLKYIVSLIIGCTKEQLEDQEFKMKPLEGEWQYAIKGAPTMTARLMLQLIGTEGGRDLIHHNIWVNALMADYKHGTNAAMESKMPDWIITDMRFPNELYAVKQRGGITIRVNRGDGDTGDHLSEIALDDFKFDYTISNDGTIEELTKKIRLMLQNESILKVG